MTRVRVRLWERLFGIGLWLLLAALVFAQQNPAAIAAHNWRETHERPILVE